MINSIFIDTKNVNDFVNKFIKQFPEEIKKEVLYSAERIEKTYKATLRGNGHYKTGALERSITKNIFNSGFNAEIGSNSVVSEYIEFGTKPHKIRVKKASVLTDGESFFGKEVNHPGTTGTHDLEQSYSQVIGIDEGKFIKRLKNRADKIK